MSDAWLPVTAIFLLAGLVKGVTGMGLPTVSMGLLGLLMTPVEAAALLVIPSFITNVWQFAAGPNRSILLRRMWPMLLAICIATWLGTGWLAAPQSAAQATAALGIALTLYALTGLGKFHASIPPRTERWLSPAVGIATGLITGATGVFVVPTVPYIQALGLPTDELVQALGLSFTVSTIALAIGLVGHNALQVASIGSSLLCTVPALFGMQLGQWVRLRVDPTTFRLLFFIGLLALGADLAVRPLV